MTFDGANSETIPIEPRVNYQVTFELKSDPGQSFAPYNDVSPAMPMTSSAFDVYLSDGRYLIYTGETEQTYAGDPTRATRISVANLEDGALVVVDGETVWSGARLKTLSEIVIGKGYLNRTWKGKISRPVVCVTPEGATAASLAADPAKVGCEL